MLVSGVTVEIMESKIFQGHNNHGNKQNRNIQHIDIIISYTLVSVIIMGIIKNHKDLNNYFQELIRHDKIKIVSESDNRLIMDVNGTQVTIQTKKGTTLYLCTCESYLRNCNSPSFCKHRDAARLFLFYQPIYQKTKECLDVADTNHKVEESFSFEDRFLESVAKYLGRSQKIVTEKDRQKFIQDYPFAEKLMQEFEYVLRRRANHHYYKMIIGDILWAK